MVMNPTRSTEDAGAGQQVAISPWLDAERRRSLPRSWRRWWRPLVVAGSSLAAITLWWLGMRGAAAALTGATGLAVAFVVGIAFIRWLLAGSHGVIAVARALVEEAAGSRLPAVIVLLVVLGLPILPLVLDPAERLEYRMQFLLDWSLSGGSFLLAMLSIALACSTLCGDIDSQRIHMTLVKPIERWQYLLGKWIGIVLLNALLVVLVGIGVYAAATTLRQSRAVDAADRLAVNEQVLTARIATRPEHPRRAEFDQAVEAAVEQIRESEPDLFARDPAGARNRVKSWEVLRWHTVTASKVSSYDFTLAPPDRLSSDVIQLRIKPFCDNASMDRADVRFAVWLNDRPFPLDEGQHTEFTFSSGSFHTLDLPASAIDESGRLRVTIANKNLIPPGDTEPTSLSFVPGKGMEMLYRVDSFEWNFVRGLIVMWSKLAMLAAAGLAAASWLGFPIAVMASLVVYAAAVARGFLADAVDIYTGLDDATPTITSMLKLRLGMLAEKVFKLEWWEAIKTVTSFVADAFLALIPSFGRYDAITEVSTGRLCSLPATLGCFGEFAILYPLLLLAIGWALLERRDLVNLSGS
jgi:hypothetical protein